MIETPSGKRTDSKHLGELWDDRFERCVKANLRSEVCITLPTDILCCSIVGPLIRSLHFLPPTISSPLQPPLTHVLHALINVPVADPYTAKWLASDLSQSSESVVVDTPRRLFDLFNAVLHHYIAYDPDDVAVRAKCRQEETVLDELVVPLPIILARLAKGSVSARLRLRDWILPRDLYARSCITFH
jgi:hypothetical protein